MSAKGYILSLSLAGTVAALSCWIYYGRHSVSPPPAASTVKSAPPASAGRVPSRSAPVAPAQEKPVSALSAARAARQPADFTRPLSTEELSVRAAQVEQEANHELRRLVTLLDLDEAQQDRIFQTLAEHSPAWTPGMQIASAPGSAAATGKRSTAAAPLPGSYAGPFKDSAPLETPAVTVPLKPDESSAGTDPTDEIMALLDPDQQNTLLEAEMDRSAWWAEILEQITPPDEVPALIPSTGAGEAKVYEGSGVLE